MIEDKLLKTLLESIVSEEDKSFSESSDEAIENLDNNSIEESKARIFKQAELHKAAHDAVELEVSRFREEVYTVAKSIAEREQESKIITESHVLRARHEIWRPQSKMNLYDGCLALGGILGGSAVTHVFEVSRVSSEVAVEPPLVIAGFLGTLFLGMGIIGKAKG